MNVSQVSFDPRTMLGMQVATAVAEEILNNLQNGEKFLSPNYGTRPVLSGIEDTNEMRPLYVFLSENQYLEDIQINVYLSVKARGEFCVSDVVVKFYMPGRCKIEERWGRDTLVRLKEHRPWNKPEVR